MYIHNLFAIYSLFYLSSITFTTSLRFFLPAGGERCIHEDVDKNEVIIGEYEVNESPTGHVSIQVRDSKGHSFFQKSDLKKGKFTFSSEEDDMCDICFTSSTTPGISEQREIFVDIKHGDETNNYAAMAESENLKPIEAELKKIEYLSDYIVKDFIAMHSRADAMRNINASTHSRVLYFSIFSMLCLVALAIWQILYLRRYFKSKKLID